MEKEHNIERVVNDTLGKLRNMMEVDTVIGKPVVLDETTKVIPISKVTLGYLVGGGEYSSNVASVKGTGYPFSTGTGGGVTVHPIGFLVYTNGNVKLIRNDDRGDFEKILDKLPGIIQSIATSFKDKENE